MGSRDLEEYMAWDKAQHSTWGWMKKNLQPVHMFGIIVLCFFGWYLIENEKTSPHLVLGAITIVILLVIFKGRKAEKGKPIPLPVMTAIASQYLKREIGRRFPSGTIIPPTPFFSMRFQKKGLGEAFAPWKWEIGFRLIYPGGLRKDLLVIADPWEGVITGSKEIPEGYNGQQSKDVSILMPTQIIEKEEKPSKVI